jgi:oxygen-dependent protoporphyrinogen oxidase
MEREVSVAVIGAGLSGLTVAYRLSGLRDAHGRAPRITVLEAGDRIGGIVDTIERDGFVIERGPDSMITEKPWGVELCRDLGIENEILSTNSAFRRSFIARGPKLHPVPEGFHLMAPSRLLPFARSSVLSWRGKLRVAMEPFIAVRTDRDDESLASFVRRRLGEEALVRVAQPMVGGIYTADPERLSLRATMPRFVDMERKHGGVVRGLIAARRRASAGVNEASGPRYELFVALRAGMGALPRALAATLPAGAFRFATSVGALERVGSSSGIGQLATSGEPRASGRLAANASEWRVSMDSGPVDADAVCLALPSYAAAELLTPTSSSVAHELEAIEYASTATVTLAWRREDIAHRLDGFGFVVPAIERRTTLACTFSSVKFSGRAPAGHVLLRAFVGGALAPENFALDDDAMTGAEISDLRELLGVRRPPLWIIVSRYARSMPQYHVGHLARMGRINVALASIPTLALTGNAYIGAGIPDTIRSANAAADRIASALALTRPAA